MRKFIFMLVAIFAAVSTTSAQIATENSTFFDNISFGVTGGASAPLDFNSVFPLNTNAGLKIQKNFTPEVGLQIEGLAFLNDNHFSDIKTAVKATNVGVNGVFNLSNIFCGYQGTPRKFEVSAVAGLGWLYTWNTSVNNLSAKTGLDFSYNLGSKRAWSIILTPAVYWNLNKINKIRFDKHKAQLALNVTLAYHFGNSNGTHHFKTYDIGAMLSEIDRLNGALAECESREPKVIEKIIIKEVPVETAAPVKNSTAVFFAKKSAELTEAAKCALDKIPEGTEVEIEGFSSPEGSAKFNELLSERRAVEVADYLAAKGVKVKSAVGKGVTGPESPRAAIVK